MNTPLANLIDLLRQDKIIPVIGAGFSNAVADLPGWRGAIEDGLDYAAARYLDAPQIAQARLLLNQGELTGAATVLKQLLHAPGYPFADWIARLFHNPPIKRPELLRSLPYLCAPIILTTNYDNLLSATKLLGQRQVCTWRDYQLLQQALHDKASVIVHLHGAADRPDTVILSADDYAALNQEAGYKTVLQQLWSSYHFLFIGCSSDGIQDDDFSTIIHFLGEWFPLSRHQHYALLHQSAIDHGTHVALLQQCNIETISLGTDYAGLPEFINTFNPNKERYLEALNADLADIRQSAADIHRLVLAGNDAASRRKLTAWLHNVLPAGAYWIASPQLTAMEQALQEVDRTLAGNKQKLVLYQEVTGSLIQHSEVSDAIAK